MDGIRVIKSSNIGSEQALLVWKQYCIFVFVLTPKKEENYVNGLSIPHVER